VLPVATVRLIRAGGTGRVPARASRDQGAGRLPLPQPNWWGLDEHHLPCAIAVDGRDPGGRSRGADDPRPAAHRRMPLIAAGADVKAVQVVLGHSAATTMDLYGHLFSEATWQAMERLPAIPLMETLRAIGPSRRDSSGTSVPAEPGGRASSPRARSMRDPAGWRTYISPACPYELGSSRGLEPHRRPGARHTVRQASSERAEHRAWRPPGGPQRADRHGGHWRPLRLSPLHPRPSSSQGAGLWTRRSPQLSTPPQAPSGKPIPGFAMSGGATVSTDLASRLPR